MAEAGSSRSNGGGQARAPAGSLSVIVPHSSLVQDSRTSPGSSATAGALIEAAPVPHMDKGKGKGRATDFDFESQEHMQKQQSAVMGDVMLSHRTFNPVLHLFDRLDVETLRLENDMLRRQAAVLARRNGSMRTAPFDNDASSPLRSSPVAGAITADHPELRHLVEQSLKRSCTALQKDKDHLKIRLRESNGQRARLEQELRYLRSFLLESVQPVCADESAGYQPVQQRGRPEEELNQDSNQVLASAGYRARHRADPGGPSSDLPNQPGPGIHTSDIDVNDASTLPAGSENEDGSFELVASGGTGNWAPVQRHTTTAHRPDLPTTAPRQINPNSNGVKTSPRRSMPVMGDAETEFLLMASKRLTLPHRKRLQPLHPGSQIPLLPGGLEEAIALSQAVLHAYPLEYARVDLAVSDDARASSCKRELQNLFPKLGSPIRDGTGGKAEGSHQQRGRAGSRAGRRPSTYKERSLSPLSPRRESGIDNPSAYSEDAQYRGGNAAMAVAIAGAAPRTSAGEMGIGTLGPAFAQVHGHAHAPRQSTPPLRSDPMKASPVPTGTGTPGGKVPKRIGRPKGSPNKTKTISINETQSTRRRMKAQEFAAQNGGLGRGRGRPSESQSPEQAARPKQPHPGEGALHPGPAFGMSMGAGSSAYQMQMPTSTRAPATPDLGYSAAFGPGHMDVDMAHSVFGSGGSGNVGDLLLAAHSLDYTRAGSAAASASASTSTRARPVVPRLRSPEQPKGKGPAQNADDEEEEEYYYEDEEDEDDPTAGQSGMPPAPHWVTQQQRYQEQPPIGRYGYAPVQPGTSRPPGQGYVPHDYRPPSTAPPLPAPSASSQAMPNGDPVSGGNGSALALAAPPSPLSIVSSRPNRSNLPARRKESSNGASLGRQISALDVLADQAQAAASVDDSQDAPAASGLARVDRSTAAPASGPSGPNANAFRAPFTLPPMPPARAGAYNGDFATAGGGAMYPGAPAHWASGSSHLDDRKAGLPPSDSNAPAYPHSQSYPYLQFGQYAQLPTQQQQGVKRSRSGSRRSSGTPGPAFGQGSGDASVDAEGDLVAPPRTIAEQLRLGVESSHHLIDQADIASGMTPAAALAKKARSPYTKWTAEEDEVLVRGIAEHGTKWDEVAKGLEMRSYHQCRQRWLRGLKSGDALPSHLRHLKDDIDRAIAAHEKVKGAKRASSVMPETQRSEKRPAGRGRRKRGVDDDEVEEEYEEE